MFLKENDCTVPPSVTEESTMFLGEAVASLCLVDILVDSEEFLRECYDACLLSEGVDDQIAEWHRQVSDAMDKYNRFNKEANKKGGEAALNTLCGLLLFLAGGGIYLALQASAGGAAAVAGIIALVLGLVGAIYFLVVGAIKGSEAAEARMQANKYMTELRLKARRLLPQLDELERKNLGVSTVAILRAVRSTLEAIAQSEYEEKQARELAALHAQQAAAANTADMARSLNRMDSRLSSVERRATGFSQSPPGGYGFRPGSQPAYGSK